MVGHGVSGTFSITANAQICGLVPPLPDSSCHLASPATNTPVLRNSVVSDSAALWTVAHQAPPSMGFSRQQYGSGLPFPSSRDLPNPGIEPKSPVLQADSLPAEAPGNEDQTGNTGGLFNASSEMQCRSGPPHLFVPWGWRSSHQRMAAWDRESGDKCQPSPGNSEKALLLGCTLQAGKPWIDRPCCSVAQSCPILCDPMDSSTPGLPVHHHLLKLAQTHIH